MLFSSLTASSSSANAPPTTAIPTAVQLFCGNKSLDFVHHSTTTGKDNTTTGHAAMLLTYQAVEVGAPAAAEAGNLLFGRHSTSSSSQQQQLLLHAKPNWGVWNCRVVVGSSNVVVEKVLQNVMKKASVGTYILTIDLGEAEPADASQVEPTMTALQQVLVRHLKTTATTLMGGEDSQRSSTAATTSLAQLEQTKFGQAPLDEQATAAPEDDCKVVISLVLCALVPSLSSSSSYQDKQAQALLQYHLRRFAAALDCTLCLVRTEPSESDTSNNSVPSSSMESLAATLRHITLGELAPEDEADNDITFTPGHHDTELIESVLLRNAHCAGKWDASKDSLWVALPVAAKENDKSSSTESPPKSVMTMGDEDWLSKLKDSMGATTERAGAAAPVTQAPVAVAPSETKEVSSFFESLLKSKQ